MSFDWTTFFYVVAIGILVLAFFYTLYLLIVSISRRKKGKEPSHVELYFDENFRKIIDEWDLMSRDKVKDFKKDMGKRLSKIGTDLDSLDSRKESLDNRLTAVEKGMEKLEGF